MKTAIIIVLFIYFIVNAVFTGIAHYDERPSTFKQWAVFVLMICFSSWVVLGIGIWDKYHLQETYLHARFLWLFYFSQTFRNIDEEKLKQMQNIVKAHGKSRTGIRMNKELLMLVERFNKEQAKK